MYLDAKKLIQLGVENIINYLRRSRADIEYEKKTGEDTLKKQTEIMDRVLTPYGIPFIQRTEIGSGDKISTRPVFQGIIEELRAGIYQAIAVKEIPRLGRGSYTDMGTIYDLIIEKNIYIITQYRVFDPSNPADLRQIRFELFMSREEFETTRERLMSGRIGSAWDGKWVAGAPPYGYNYDEKSGKLVINQEQAKAVRDLFNMYINGIPVPNNNTGEIEFKDAGYYSLATHFKRNTSYLTPSGTIEWNTMVVKKLLLADRFIGVARFKPRGMEPIVIEDAHEAIIDLDTWEKVQAKIQDRRDNYSKYPRTRSGYSSCELASLVVCKKCGRRMIRSFSSQPYKKKNGEVVYHDKESLWCRQAGCSYLSYRAIEKEILRSLEILQELDSNRLESIMVGLISERPTERLEEAKTNALSVLKERRINLKKRLNFIYDKYEDGKYDDEVFMERKQGIETELSEIDELERTYSEAAPTKQSNKVDSAVVRKNITTILQAYQSTDNKEKKNDILRAVLDSVTVELTEPRQGRRAARFNLYPKLRADILKPIF